DVRVDPDDFAGEPRRGDADDRDPDIVDQDSLADDAGIIVKATRPIAVADRRNRRRVGAALDFRTERPAVRRGNPEDREVISGDETAARMFQLLMRAVDAHVEPAAAPRGDDVAEDGGLARQIRL